MTDNNITNEIKSESLRARAILAAADLGEYDAEASMKELEELAKTAGAEVVAQIVQKLPAPNPATLLGEGKIQELKETAAQLNADLVIFDCELTASRIRNIEDILNVRVIDRTMLILDIFAGRAVTNEGKLQVELAQLKYRLPRLAGIGASMSRLGGGIGTRGPGETRLETDRRHIRSRIDKLEENLKELEKRREFSRSRRKKDNVLTAAIVGYTNAGKSTLLNNLAGADVLAENKLFATLDLTSRGIELPDGRTVIVTDTVGLIRRLPHNLVEAFKSTLEEAASADIILHVIDISDSEAAEKTDTTRQLLAELGCGDIPVINVLNKCDLLQNDIPESKDTVKICAKTREGFDRLLKAISENLRETSKRIRLLLPYERAGLASKIREQGKIFSEEYAENGIKIDALADNAILKELSEFEVN
ncbi:MAG TPA: GTPase HflX [Ruminococcaceae bacterium]|nr:GTPase HflX [Oscillospiraceae bacterium]